MEFKLKRLLTRPVLKFSEGTPHYVKLEAAMYIGKDMKVKDGETPKEPATLIDVIDLETGESAQIVMNAVVKSVLNESYPNDTYVGKCFCIVKQGRQPGKSYNSFRISEIEEPSTEPARAHKK